MEIAFLYKAKIKIADFLYTLPRKICYLLELQLFINILTLPIFMSWGLPISLLSPLGNLIFTPWLIAFLTLSSLLFFMQILSIENNFLIYLLEKLNLLFFYFLDFGHPSVLISFSYYSKIFLFLIPCCLFLICILSKSGTYTRLISFLLFSMLLFLTCKYICIPKDILEHITNKKKEILIIKRNAKNILIDYGALSEGQRASSWTKYKLIPKLFKLGISHIDYLIIPLPSNKALESTVELCKNLTIKKIYIQQWQGRLSWSGWQCWKEILDFKKSNQLALIYLKKSLKISLDKKFTIICNPQDALIRKGTLTYNQINIEINNGCKDLSHQNS